MATPSSCSQGSDEYNSLVCLPCHRDEETLPAFGYCINCQEHLCHTCYKHHKKATPSKQHQLQDKDVMPSTQQLTDTIAHSRTNDDLATPCPRHKKELIKFYCRDHELLLCSVCVTLEHTKPCDVQYIPEISGKIINSKYYNNIMYRTDKLLKKCTTMKKEASRDANKTKESLKNALQEIMKYRQEINKRIDELHQEIHAKIQALQNQNDQQMKTIETVCGDVMTTVKGMYDTMKQLNKSKQADHLFMEVKQAQKQLNDYEQSISSLSTGDCMDEYKAINDVLQTEKMIGDISSKHQREGSSSQLNLLPPSAGQIITPSPTCLGEICVKSSKDMNGCWIKGMTVLPPDRLVLTDMNNSIKLVDVNSKSIISHLSLGTENADSPWDITSTTSTQVAVTVPVRQRIQFISVSNKLSKTHTILTDGECRGICCHQDKLIVTYQQPGKLEILDMEGKVINRVKTDSTGQNVFCEPGYVQANSSSIYVSDIGLCKVIMLDWTGKIIGRIADIEGPGSLALLDDGSLLITISTNGDFNVCSVYLVSDDCTSSKIVLQNMIGLDVVCVDEREQKLYISRLTDDDELNNSILVYT